MCALARLCLLFVALRSSDAEAELAPPHGLEMITLNTNYTLSWEWEKSAAGSENVTFTVQYAGNHQVKKKNPRWSSACAETSARSCDLTGLDLYYLGLYVLKVRANLNGRHSEWQSKQFCPDKEAALGPPHKVRLDAIKDGMDIFITEPQTSSNSSMRDLIPDLCFQIIYWEAGKASQAKMHTYKVNFVTLSNLPPWTQYCVQVRSHYEFYDKNSSFTSPVCIQTLGITPWWNIFLYFLCSLLGLFLLVMFFFYGGYRCFQFCKATIYPVEKLPSFFKQVEPEYPQLIVPDTELGQYDLVTVIFEGPILEYDADPAAESAAPPAGLHYDSSGRHSRQNSGDSGVYSAGGNSGSLQPNVTTSSPHVTRSFDSEKTRMLDGSPVFKVPPEIPDEGVVDMEV